MNFIYKCVYTVHLKYYNTVYISDIKTMDKNLIAVKILYKKINVFYFKDFIVKVARKEQ